MKKFLSLSFLAATILTSAMAAAGDLCVVDLNIALKDNSTNVISAYSVTETKTYPIYRGYCDGSSGASLTSAASLNYFFTPMVLAANESATRVANMNFLNGDASALLSPSGRVTAVVSKLLSGTKTTFKTLNYYCLSGGCDLITRPICGLYRGGLADTNLIASPNPPNSVSDTDAACISYCAASGTIAGDMCVRGKVIIKRY